jgi:hypothetical protein
MFLQGISTLLLKTEIRCLVLLLFSSDVHGLVGAWLLWMSLEEQHLPQMGWQSHGAAVNTFFL